MIKTEAIYGKIMTLLHNIALERRECLLRTKTVDKYLRNSIVYGYAVTQPFLLYAEPAQGLQQMIIGESEIVKYGENSEIVRHIQQKLMNLGYYEDKIDGTYGLLTEHAVKGFQSSYHIEVTGQVNEQTMKEMITEEKRRQFKNIQSEIDRIYYGASNKDVTKVQEVLFYYGYYQGDIDGIYGPLTDKALEEASQDNVLPGESNSEHPQEEVSPLSEAQKPAANEKAKDVIQLQTSSQTNMVQTAKNFIGTPYVWGGTSPNGFDCSGFIQFVYQEQNISIPRTVRDIWNFASPIEQPSIGDLVFFETYQPGPSHLGIYLGDGNFIHAGSSNGVEISNMNNTEYWQSRYIGAKRIQ